MSITRANDWHALFGRLKRFLVRNVQKFTRLGILALLSTVLLHLLFPPSIEWLGEFLGFEPPSLTAVLAWTLLILVFERVIVIEAKLGSTPVQIHSTREEAYKALLRTLEERGVRRADLLQFSGMTALPILQELTQKWPKARVRLLLVHPDQAAQFDTDLTPDHRHRISTAVGQIKVWQKDPKRPRFKVQLRHYRTPASISAVVINDRIVSISWYHCYQDPQDPTVTRIRGHQAPTITATGAAAEPLLAFAKSQFDALWRDSGPIE